MGGGDAHPGDGCCWVFWCWATATGGQDPQPDPQRSPPSCNAWLGPRGCPLPRLSSVRPGLRFQGAQLTALLPVVARDSCHILSAEPGMCCFPRHGAGQASDPWGGHCSPGRAEGTCLPWGPPVTAGGTQGTAGGVYRGHPLSITHGCVGFHYGATHPSLGDVGELSPELILAPTPLPHPTNGTKRHGSCPAHRHHSAGGGGGGTG